MFASLQHWGFRSCLVLVFSLLPGRASVAAPWMDYAALYQDSVGAVVVIYGQTEGRTSKGTGAVIRPDGLVVTNAHVVLNPATGRPFDQLTIFTHPGQVTGNFPEDLSLPHACDLISVDPALDIALMRMYPRDAEERLDHLPVGDSESVAIGEPTFAIGHPESGAFWTLTTGQIGARFQDFGGVDGRHMFQMETSVNRGNSGGPLIDGNGQLIGINSMIARQSEDGLAITGINFALRSGVVRDFVARSGELLDQEPRELEPVPPPAVAVVGAAEAPPAPNLERTSSVTVQAPVPAPQSRPDPQAIERAPEPTRGYQSRLPPGTVKGPRALLAKRAESAFDDMDAELSSGLGTSSSRSAKTQSGGPLVLITDSEGRMTDAPAHVLESIGRGRTTSIASGSGSGTQVIVNRPTHNSTVDAPLVIDVDFKPSAGARIDVSSVKISYVKMFSMDVTERLAEYVSASGIKVDEADMPDGTHTFQIEVKDTAGKSAETTIRATVR